MPYPHLCLCLHKTGEGFTQYSLHNVHLQYQWVMGLTRHPRILHVLEAVLGPDVILLDSRFICKYPTPENPKKNGEEGTKPNENVGGSSTLPYVAWHQDMRWVWKQVQNPDHVLLLLHDV